jgi:hypothetical protein
LEHRTKILDIAAFLDRMDRSVDQNAENDFRVVAFRQALSKLCSEEPERVEKIQMVLSDQTVEPLARRDRQGAYGASVRNSQEEM